MTSKIFISGPLGFTLSGRTFLTRTLYPALRGNAFDVLDQWSLNIETDEAALENDPAETAAKNVALLLEADAVLAVLDGPDVDSGTAAEIGFASAAGTPIVGYRSDTRADHEGHDQWRGNLQVAHFIRRSGGMIVTDLDAAILLLQAIVGDR